MPKETFMDYKELKEIVDPVFEQAVKMRTNLGDDSTKTEKKEAVASEKRLYRETIKKHPETKAFLTHHIELMD
jgi:hypothetical protein